jgi:hypothetical protein
MNKELFKCKLSTISAIGILTLSLGSSLASAGDMGGMGPQAAALSYTAPSSAGIPYRWHVTMSDQSWTEFENYVGAKSWWEPTTPPQQRPVGRIPPTGLSWYCKTMLTWKSMSRPIQVSHVRVHSHVAQLWSRSVIYIPRFRSIQVWTPVPGRIMSLTRSAMAVFFRRMCTTWIARNRRARTA